MLDYLVQRLQNGFVRVDDRRTGLVRLWNMETTGDLYVHSGPTGRISQHERDLVRDMFPLDDERK